MVGLNGAAPGHWKRAPKGRRVIAHDMTDEGARALNATQRTFLSATCPERREAARRKLKLLRGWYS